MLNSVAEFWVPKPASTDEHSAHGAKREDGVASPETAKRHPTSDPKPARTAFVPGISQVTITRSELDQFGKVKVPIIDELTADRAADLPEDPAGIFLG